ncbi:probable tetraacyldisaccharide 4'-kinase, mitochondrial isoform X2 [Magnolia sinica]|uniref:probable tetraacyldisaccharide 4'-kinase, mitochondrial isoform X2 n=1 Tax=Magnolia sinica TaxID=86752 RepID=UPI00265B5DD2|nr:probable tetraacyldisaccharide 4'-kinase, mitochondrial isoform X2 [Magnolia sinica]
MENLRRAITQIANAQTQDLQNLSHFSRFCLIPFLSFSSSLYRLSLFLRHNLYLFGLFRKQRLPVRVISVGNLTWGGNGKTPMVEYIALLLSNSGITPLVLTRGYAGGDEAKMLQRHLLSTSAKIGVGANRAGTAAWFLEKYGYIDQFSTCFEKHCPGQKSSCSEVGKIGAVILDDGMQHWSLLRDLEIVMVNGIIPWGNGQLLPRGPLREPLTALRRADVAVIHHADLISDRQLRHIKATVREIKETLPILFSRMSPSHFFEVKNCDSKLPLTTVKNMVVLCVSAIGCPNAFVLGIEQIGPLCVDRLDFSDHHFFQAMDIMTIKERLKVLKDEFRVKPIIVVTEKLNSMENINTTSARG